MGMPNLIPQIFFGSTQISVSSILQYKFKSAIEFIRVDGSSSYIPALIQCLLHRHSFLLMNEKWPASYQQRFIQMVGESRPRGECYIATSGSTGTPKLCVHSIESLFKATRRSKRSITALKDAPFLISVKPSSMGGLLSIVTAIDQQAPIMFPNQHWIDTLSNSPFNSYHLTLVPQQLPPLFNVKNWPNYVASLLIGGDFLPMGMLKQLQKYPCSYSYGLTETAGQVFATTPHSKSIKLNPLPFVKWDTDSQSRLLVKTNTLAKGYLSDHGFTPLPLTKDGYFLTNDLVTKNPFSITGRFDYQFQSGASLVCPEFVESTLLASGYIQRICVVPQSDDTFGFVPIAYVDSLDDMDKLIDCANQQLPIHMRPKRYVLYAFPLNEFKRNHLVRSILNTPIR